MASLWWYFPNAGVANKPRDWFAAAGAAEALRFGDDDPEQDAEPGYLEQRILAGPDGGQGRIAFWDDPRPTRARPFCINLDKQTWYQAPKKGELPAGRFWLGHWKDQPIEPQDLLRRRPCEGTPAALGRHRWIVPLARALPRVMSFNEEGDPVWQFEYEQHIAYHDEARRLADELRQDSTDGVLRYDEMEHLRFAVRALQMNYRVTIEVLDLMRAVRKEDLWQAVWHAAGLPLHDRDVKKKPESTDAGDSD